MDFCCGLKGFSVAFLEDGWEVITVDVEPKFMPTICKDIRELTIEDIEGVTRRKLIDYDLVVVLASPPCERLSQAPHVWPLPGIREALEITGAVLELITKIKPKYWCIENPSTGKMRWFIGEPAKRIRLNAFGYKTVKPTGLWGNIPLGLVPDSARKNGKGITFSNHFSKRRDLRDELPHGLSEALLQAVNR